MKIRLFLAVALMVVMFTSCGGKKAPQAETTEVAPTEQVEVVVEEVIEVVEEAPAE